METLTAAPFTCDPAAEPVCSRCGILAEHYRAGCCSPAVKPYGARQLLCPAGGFLAWMGELADEWRRVLKPNGSLYVFASPQMAARVECVIAERFEVLNHVVWVKRNGWHRKAGSRQLRNYFGQTERVVVAHHRGADQSAGGSGGWSTAPDTLFLFEPLRAYLDAERRAAGVSLDDVRAIVGCAAGSGLPGHWFGRSQWQLPTAAHYQALAAATGRFARAHADLVAEFEQLRRPFDPGTGPRTDVWDFDPLPARPGKHVCEKPLPLLEHVIATSSRPGALVLDCFAGSAATGEAALRLGRAFHGIELDETWVARGRDRLAAAHRQRVDPDQPTLFDDPAA